LKNKNLIIKVILCTLIMYTTGFIFIKNEISNPNGPMGVVLIGLPLFTLITSLIMQLLLKKKVIVLSVIFIGYLISTFAVFNNSSFIIWCFIYTVIALFGTLISDLILKCKKRLLRQDKKNNKSVY